MTARCLMPLAAMLALTSFLSPSVPARAQAERGRSLDDELLESLNADPLDEFDRELFAPEDPSKGPSPQDSPAGQSGSAEQPDDLMRELRRELGPAAVPEEDSPLLEIARRMRDVEGLIGQAESGPKTQGLQGQIVANLQELIKQARSRAKQCKSSQCNPNAVAARRKVSQPAKKPAAGQGKPNPKPATSSDAPPGTAAARRPDMDQMKEVLKRLWGELPEKAREQMLQLPVEEFLPKYELLIEQYFQRLAEEPGAGKDE